MPKGIYEHKKGYHLSEEHKERIRRGNMGKKCPWAVPSIRNGKDNGMWKGDNVSYSALHHWIMRNYGKPNTCEHCGRTGLKGKFIDWANKSGKYLRDLSDWMTLCKSCHKIYDLNKKA